MKSERFVVAARPLLELSPQLKIDATRREGDAREDTFRARE